MNDHTHIYEPHKQLKLGMKIWAEMFRELFQFRELIWRLFIRDLSAKYKQSVLGNLWSLVMPFVAIGTFMYLNHAGILDIGQTQMPYPLYALIGLSVWQVFATGLSSGANSLVGAGDLITKISFPREVLVIASMAQSVFEFLIKFVLIIVFFLVFQFSPSWNIVFLPLVLVPLVFLTVGLALILALLNGVMRDIGNIVSLLLMFLMFLTPVLYPIPGKGLLFFELNFLSPLVNAPRDLIAFGHIQQPGHFMMAAGISLLIFLVSWRIFHLAETKIPERM
ncbi:MAG: ABC transporter permease [Candidatus Omnitrophica bacterium]|nr:ABC transporter permease [Candidatus Omnitrophota bacterium]